MLAAERAAAVPRPPRNPWLTTLFWLWLGGLIVVIVLEIASASSNNPNSNGELTSSYDPGLGAALQALALVFLGLALLSFIAWLTVKAIAWRAPEPASQEETAG